LGPVKKQSQYYRSMFGVKIGTARLKKQSQFHAQHYSKKQKKEKKCSLNRLNNPKKGKSVSINKCNSSIKIPIIIGFTGKSFDTMYAGSVIRVLNALLFITKWYNIGKKGLAFYVNIANICTDITLENSRKLYLMKGNGKERIENLQDDLFPLFCRKIRGDI